MLSKASVPALPSIAGPGQAIHALEWEPGVAAGGPASYAGPYCTDYAEEVKASAPKYDPETRISTLLGASLHNVYIIDGYNLLRRGFGFESGHRALECQRAMLEVLLREFQRARPESHLVLVYDGAAPGIRPAIPRPGPRELEILFSTPPLVADDLVLEEARRRCRSASVTVITSDRKDIVSNLNKNLVRHQSSEDFAIDMQEALENRPRRTPKPKETKSIESTAKSVTFTGLDETELARWMQIFGETTLESIALEVTAEEEANREEESRESGDESGDLLSENEVDEWLDFFDNDRGKT